MKNKINYIIREVPPEQTDFSFYFDDDGLTGAGGDYCYNLFIVAQSRDSGGFNEKEYTSLQTEIDNLLEMYVDIMNKSNYAQYSSVGAMLKDYRLIDSIHNTRRIKAFTDFFADCCESPIAYTTRAEGWGADIYAFGNTAIATGYAPFGNIRPEYETNQRYEQKAMKATEGFYDYHVKKAILQELIEEYIKEVTK